MKKIKPNKYDAAVKAAEAFETENQIKAGTLTGQIPAVINEGDGKRHYHVLMIKQRHDAKNKRYIATATPQTFSKGPAFEKIAKNYATHGFSSIIILHDPTKNVDQDKPELKQFEKSAIATQIEKEEEAAKNRRIAERIAEEEKKALDKKEPSSSDGSETGPGNDNDPKTYEFNGNQVTEADIDQFAKDNKVDVSKAKSVDGKLAMVKKFIEDQKA